MQLLKDQINLLKSCLSVWAGMVVAMVSFVIFGKHTRNETLWLLFGVTIAEIVVDGDKLTLAQEDAVTMPLYELELQMGMAISPIVMLKKQWENRPMITPFYLNVKKEGIRL